MLGQSDHEPPYTVPYVRWCERTRADEALSYSIHRVNYLKRQRMKFLNCM
jgi:hypothetical protein